MTIRTVNKPKPPVRMELCPCSVHEQYRKDCPACRSLNHEPEVKTRGTVVPLSVNPSCRAVAMYLLEFESGRPAVRPGQLVVLEFTPSMVIVHDPLRISPSESNKLGVILYSHNWAPYDKEYSLQRAMETGEVSAKMAYGLLKLRKIDKAGTAECMICGKHIGKKTSTEDRQRHLEGHINA